MNFTKATFDCFWEDVVVKNFPDAKIRYKDEVWWMKYFVRFVLFFNTTFMTRYITVLGTTVYFPSRKWKDSTSVVSLISIVAHEMVHMWDRRAAKRFGIDLFSVKYGMPQALTAFSLLSFFAFINIWCLLFLSFLIFAIPWPSYWRTYYEARGYAMNLHWWHLLWKEQYNLDDDIMDYAYEFTSSQYYWMSYNSEAVRALLRNNYETLPNTHGAFKEVTEWLRTQQP